MQYTKRRKMKYWQIKSKNRIILPSKRNNWREINRNYKKNNNNYKRRKRN